MKETKKSKDLYIPLHSLVMNCTGMGNWMKIHFLNRYNITIAYSNKASITISSLILFQESSQTALILLQGYDIFAFVLLH